MAISRHDPRFQQMADEIFGSGKADIVEKEQHSESSYTIDVPRRAGAIHKGGQVIRIPRMQRLARREADATLVEGSAVREAAIPSSVLEEDALDIESIAVDSAGDPATQEQSELQEEIEDESPLDLADDLPKAWPVPDDRPEETLGNLALCATIAHQDNSDEFDEMRDEWIVFQRLFPNLEKKDFYRISFKNRFGDDL